ncbi:SRPBCC domain-containing protein [Streptomyces ficellus]|uniref:SRPBCC domain-containing protein n=1 Tax=Streptomyces ficellus TaxID=1977088 RepID=A0ABT7Z4G1_9ACTN|nr:SRPBCC domain-containing protein [Streptomyces ficellus]MDN3294395.1 SRPBCC domain-containing protein [Streptomyces ficellus]
MEHEVFVPVAVETLREVLADPARVAPCVPGLQQDADASAGPLSGRLKVRAGGHSITYRGALRVVAQDDGAYAVEGEGTEVRGTGSAKLALTVRLTPVDGGTTLGFTGTTSAEGRLAELPDDAAASAAHRLLDRFAESLADTATAAAGPAASPSPEVEAADAEVSDAQVPRATAADDLSAYDLAGELADEPDTDDDGVDQGAEGTGSVFDAPVPPPSLDPLADAEFEVPELPEVPEGPEGAMSEPAAEAAHARRTMIGRSAEEVDHAPPRGRYAPTPGPDTDTAGATLRWLAPAAALALASAVVVGRALRRRK